MAKVMDHTATIANLLAKKAETAGKPGDATTESAEENTSELGRVTETLADGDDIYGDADEDGIVFGDVAVGQLLATVTVTVSGGDGYIDAWLDFNGDGTWYGADEQILHSVAVSEGVRR